MNCKNLYIFRTEELLNGIVKLAANDALLQPNKPHKLPNKPKQALHTSKSTPLLSASQSQSNNLPTSKSALLKPPSPTATSSKRFTCKYLMLST